MTSLRVTHRSDQGLRYTSTEYVDVLKRHGFPIITARNGNPYNIAVIESFLKALKDEEVYLWDRHRFIKMLQLCWASSDTLVALYNSVVMKAAKWTNSGITRLSGKTADVLIEAKEEAQVV